MTKSVACRSCCSSTLAQIISLGRTPLANALLSAEQLEDVEETYPLELAFCQKCSLLQIRESVPPEKLFRNYVYLSSFSDTTLRHAQDLVEEGIATRKLDGESYVMEIASNDGYLLKYYQQRGITVFGIEPAANIAAVARDHGIPTLCEFFDLDLAAKLNAEGVKADIIHAHNVLAHVNDLNGFVSGVQLLLKDNGVAIIEVPYAKDLIDNCEFDTIYHEHLCYFSLTSLNNLFERHGMAIQNVKRVPIHGGSLRLYVERERSKTRRAGEVKEMLDDEAQWGVGSLEFYQGFGRRVERLREELCSLLRNAKADGKRIAAYGASAKGSTLLNYFGIGRETLDFVVDRSTVKQGRYTPGTHLPIYAPEKLLTDMPDYVLLLTWNFADEILRQQAQFRARGGRFLVPIPKVTVV